MNNHLRETNLRRTRQQLLYTSLNRSMRALRTLLKVWVSRRGLSTSKTISKNSR